MNVQNNSILAQAANHIAGGQSYPQSCLYLVPTPIGNLADITFRALHILSIVDAIACEDTRHSQQLLNQYNINQKPLFALHQHNEQAATLQLIKRLEQGERIALITDAGTPAISDPGARAASVVQHAGFRVMPLPGASSITTAMSAAGLNEAATLFHGFLSNKATEREQTLKELLTTPYHLVLLEAPHRIEALCKELNQLAPERTVTLARELTKQFEQIVTQQAANLPAWLAEKSEHKKGEFVCIIHAPILSAEEPTSTIYDEALLQALSYMPTKAATNLIADLTGASKKMLYNRALALKNNTSP